MDTFTLLLAGFASALTLSNVLAALVGCMLGTVVGILPGLGPSTTVALLIPVAFSLQPESALIMMLGVYLGAMYGGSLTSILMKVPGEASSVMTAIDGFEMAKKGRAGPALAVAAIGSFIGGTLSVIGLMLFAPLIARYALAIGPAEYFSLMVAALLFTSVLMGADMIKGLVSIAIGLLIAVVGSDLQTGVPRLTFGQSTFLEGIDIIIVLMGIFGVGEVLWYLTHRNENQRGGERIGLKGKLWLTRDDWKRSWPAIIRSSIIGFFAGVLPGAGSSLAGVLGYTVEKRRAKHPERFGQGAIEGVAAPETANNAATGGAMIPMLTLGIPGSGTTAVLLVVFTIYGIQPGPRLMTDNAELVWALIASLYISNILLLLLNLPLIPLFVKILDVPVRFLMPTILVIAAVGAYSMKNSFADVVLLFIFGGIGFLMRRLGIPLVPLILAAILAPKMEQSLRQATLLSDGDWSTFLTRPISAVFLAAGLIFVLADVISKNRRRRSLIPATAEDD
ncbi:putative tricarboxylic transport membrane protein [Cryobacterium flavum]|uniref:Putative tricarboxylic transport membrane protein n=1 Tax=Cryobacterium flavum TaxID=1424659 RepID=A0A4R8VFH5_9MICO|nr:tripartite tricarboxylate transporter permease [Cryobacterium flavum]TFB82306.1 tripartite tricarboxylate transporter permease [Cryobacterium flavum]SDN96504.1 putative tricarboxylic transport membrane protein [Cryobacterium flavum]